MSDDAVIEKEKKSKKSVERQEKIDTISDTRDSELSVNESQLVTFFLDKIEFSIDINKVKEIVRMPDIVKIPNAPAFIEGIANLRGTVLPILNTRVRFGLKRGELTDQTRILVIDINGSLTGLIVDSVKEVLRIDNSLVEPAPPAVKDVNSEFLKGVIKLNQGKRLILTIDVEKACMTQITKNAKSDVVKETAAAVSSQKRIEEHIEEELLVTFKLENEEFAFSIDNVNEIIRVPEITMVPSAPRYVRGVISLRNEILPIVDLRTFLDIKMREYNDSTRIMVVDILESKIGLVVDKVSEVLKINKKSIEAPPVILSKQEQRQLRGLAKLNEGKRLIMLFDSDGLFEQGEIAKMEELTKTKGNVKTTDNLRRAADIANDMDIEQLVGFRLSNEEFGVPIIQVQEINRLESITKVPNAPSFIEGVSNLRGNVIPVICLRKRFSMPEKENDDKTRLIIVDIKGNKTGLIVDSVSEVLRMPKKNIENTPNVILSSVDAEFMAGIGKLDNGKRMVILLNLQKLLSDTETKELAQVAKKDKAAKN